MIRKVLIANRGEIALRVISACKEMGIRTVAVYSTADRNSLHVRFADEAVCIGPPKSSDSYLNIPSVIAAAEITGADAVHPGYGLLSENAGFAEVCRASNLKFIGPPPEVTRMMGEKSTARQTMKKAKVPILPGSDGVMASEGEALEWAQTVGYPVILKAVAGGGGRGMRIVRSEAELPGLFKQASSAPRLLSSLLATAISTWRNSSSVRATSSFRCWPIEYGNVMSAWVSVNAAFSGAIRSCMEESPSDAGHVLNCGAKRSARFWRRRSLKDIGYWNAGTIEFLMDEDGQIYFIEMNTRIQVEHCVTEMVTGVDLVKAQLRIASGEKLDNIVPEVPPIRGHAIECRINAEHPEKFTPSPGRITAFNIPGGNGVRVDTAQYQDGVVPQYYDSLIAKLICHGKDREEAMNKTQRALSQFVVEGIHTTIPLHQKIFADTEFRSGQFDTKFMERFLDRQKEFKKTL